MSQYNMRVVDAELDELLTQLPALAIEGAKGVGKTATAERRAQSIHRLDNRAERSLAAADPARLLITPPPILIDEWQHVPELWDVVRRAVDADRTANRYLLTGSATPAGQTTHSGAGRIVSVRMRPLALAERGIAIPTVSLRGLLTGTRPPVTGRSAVTLADYAHEIIASGFPGLRHLSGRALSAQLDGYVARIVDSDFVEQGLAVRKPNALRRWMIAYAAASATTTSYEKIREAATGGDGDTPTRVTVQGYREVLERLWIVDTVPGWLPSRNQLARLTQAPKQHLVDPALAARLLGIDAQALLAGTPVPRQSENSPPAMPRDGTLFGQLFESLVTLSTRVYAQGAEAIVRHLRTRDGRQEIDVIVERPDRRVLAMEIKLSATVTDEDVRHLRWLRAKMGDDVVDTIIITTGPYAYRRPDGVAVVPAALLGP